MRWGKKSSCLKRWFMLRHNGILRRVSQTKLFLEYRLVTFGSKLGSKLQFKHSSVLVRMIGCHRPFRQRSLCKTFDCLLSLFWESKNCSLCKFAPAQICRSSTSQLMGSCLLLFWPQQVFKM